MIVDSHVHLDSPEFDGDRSEVIQRARDAGVELMLTIGTGSPAHASIEKTLELIEQHDFVFAALGVHPHDARLADETYLEKLRACACHPKVALWGEIGLDYYYDNSPRETQRNVFRRQLRMAREEGLPVSIHCRDAWPDLMDIIREEGGKVDGVLHSFTGNLEQALECSELGFLVSFSGILTFKNASALRETARGLNPDNVLVETDAPFLAPVPHRGKRNEPAYVVEVARVLAETMGVSLEHLSDRCVGNLRRLLRLGGANL